MCFVCVRVCQKRLKLRSTWHSSVCCYSIGAVSIHVVFWFLPYLWTLGMLQFLVSNMKFTSAFVTSLLEHLCVSVKFFSYYIISDDDVDMLVDDLLLMVFGPKTLNRQFRNAWLSIVLPIFFFVFKTHINFIWTMQNDTRKKRTDQDNGEQKTPFFI